MQTRAVYPGSFDPMTRGHLDIVGKARKVFDEIVVGIGVNPGKTRLFNYSESIALIEASLHLRGWDNVTVRRFDNALVDFAAEVKATAIMRGFRQITDFNDEFTQHGVNSRLTDLPITYFICAEEFLHVSSSTAKTLVRYDKPVDWLVDEHVSHAMIAKKTFHG